MNWPQAIHDIVIDGGGGLLTAIVIIAVFTDFFETIFGWKTPDPVEVDVVPLTLIHELRDISQEIRSMPDEIPMSLQKKLASWANRIDDAIREATEE